MPLVFAVVTTADIDCRRFQIRRNVGYAFFLQTENTSPDFQCFLLTLAKILQLNELTTSAYRAIIIYINKEYIIILSRFLKQDAINLSLFRLKAKLTMIL